MKKILYIIFVMFILLPFSKVSATEYAAQIGSTQYETIEDAITAANSGDEIVLLKDYDSYNAITITSDKNITIDLSSHSIVYLVNQGTLKLKGTGTISDYSLNPGVTNSGTLTIEGNISFVAASYSDELIENSGTLIISNAKYINETGWEVLVINDASGSVTISGGEYKASTIFKNAGVLTISGGTFETIANINSNENTGSLVINDGTFKSDNKEFITNSRGTTTINGGTFTCKNIASNYDLDYLTNTGEISKIEVNGGSFTSTDTAFSNGSLSSYSKIIINGGTITSNTTGSIIGEYNGSENNEIYIKGGTIDAKSSSGLYLYGESKFVIGDNSDAVSVTSPLIYINNGDINGLGLPKLDFYDGKITLKKKIELELNLPEGYCVTYDDGSNNTYIAYLTEGCSGGTTTPITNPSNDDVVENPETGKFNSMVILFISLLVAVATYLLVRKKNKFKNYG